ncbi:hypothetical protein [Stutzerimonas frequens]|uniref:Uncharacterized protein n=1 Tax=Stutzerimonas frequens TaxID=2968969 RepID=A0AA47E1L9_9GAMM|nr:hypothetical protein [Stutzerimonas frequens]WAE51207.1 hypothetical protein OSV15_16185 [Stutzerimonas frequens]
MSKEVKRFSPDTSGRMREWPDGDYVTSDDYDALRLELAEANADFVRIANERDALLAERDALRNDHGSMRNALKNARYRIEQGRVWNGMGWTLTGLHAHQQQKALDEIDAALQGAKP